MRQALFALIGGLNVIALPAIRGVAVLLQRVHRDLEPTRVGRNGLIRFQSSHDWFAELNSLGRPYGPQAPGSAGYVLELLRVPPLLHGHAADSSRLHI